MKKSLTVFVALIYLLLSSFAFAAYDDESSAGYDPLGVAAITIITLLGTIGIPMAIESGTGDSYMGLGSGYEAFHIDLSTGESWRLNGQNFFVNFGYSDYDNTRMELTLMYSAYGYESDVETVTLGKGLVIVDIYRDFSYGSFTFSPSLGFFIGLESFEATGASVVSYDGFSAGGGVGASMMYKFNEHHSIDTKLQLNANQSYGDDVDIIHGFGYGATLGYKYWF